MVGHYCCWFGEFLKDEEEKGVGVYIQCSVVQMKLKLSEADNKGDVSIEIELHVVGVTLVFGWLAVTLFNRNLYKIIVLERLTTLLCIYFVHIPWGYLLMSPTNSIIKFREIPVGTNDCDTRFRQWIKRVATQC